MSGKTVQLDAWLSSYKRKQYKSIYDRMKDKHSSSMTLLFQDHEKSTKEHYSELEKEYATAFNWEHTDPGEVIEMLIEEANEFYAYEVLMEHNFHLSFLANMYQIFEQQLRSFIYAELNHKLSSVKTVKLEKFGTNMKEIKEVYLLLGYDLEKNSYWETIYVLADITNAFKHGDGRSAKRLFNKHPEMFKLDSSNMERIMDRELTTNFEVVFEIDKIHFDTYANALMGFWTEFPEHLTGTHTFNE